MARRYVSMADQSLSFGCHYAYRPISTRRRLRARVTRSEDERVGSPLCDLASIVPRVAFFLAELVELTPGYCGNAFGVKNQRARFTLRRVLQSTPHEQDAHATRGVDFQYRFDAPRVRGMAIQAACSRRFMFI
jgi:hypothetical protein